MNGHQVLGKLCGWALILCVHYSDRSSGAWEVVWLTLSVARYSEYSHPNETFECSIIDDYISSQLTLGAGGHEEHKNNF